MVVGIHFESGLQLDKVPNNNRVIPRERQRREIVLNPIYYLLRRSEATKTIWLLLKKLICCCKGENSLGMTDV